MNNSVHFNGSPTVDGYYTTFDSSEVNREESSDIPSGSSDFSTAQVTVTGLPNIGVAGVIPMVHVYYDANLGKGMITSMARNITATAVLYQGYQYIFVDSVSDWTVTGSATIDEALGCIIITGDCTITYTAGSGNDDSTVG